MTPHPLSPRELEALRLAASGLSRKEVAARMGITVKTVGVYLGDAYDKLGVGPSPSRLSEAVRIARLRGLLGEGDSTGGHGSPRTTQGDADGLD